MTEDKYPKEIHTLTIMLLVFKLLKDEQSYAYKIIKDIAKMTDQQLIVEEGYLYPLMTKWVKQGWLRYSWYQTKDGHKQKHYEITMAGRNHYNYLKDCFHTLQGLLD